jgi:hypothetical protein
MKEKQAYRLMLAVQNAAAAAAFARHQDEQALCDAHSAATLQQENGAKEQTLKGKRELLEVRILRLYVIHAMCYLSCGIRIWS